MGRPAAVGLRRRAGGDDDPASRRLAQPHPQRRDPAVSMKDFKPQHFNWRMDGGVAVIRLKRPERKNPITFESYAELRDTFRKLVDCRRRQGGGVRLERRQFLLRRRRARHHRPAARARHEGPARLHPHDRRSGQGDARLSAADHRRGRRRLRRRRRHDRAVLRSAPRHAAGEDRVPVHPRRPCRLRHGRLRHAAARDRTGPRRGTAVHRPHHDGGGRRALGLLQSAGRGRRSRREAIALARSRSRPARPSRT